MAIVVAAVAAVLVLSAAIVVPLVVAQNDDDEGRTNVEGPKTAATDETSNLDAVRSYDDLGNQHLEPGESHTYPQTPPVGGDHAPYWLECGVYDHPLPDVNVVHDLEHGTIWLTYRADLLDQEGITHLAELLPDNGIMSPHPDQEAPVVITVWGRQLELLRATDPRIELFIATFGAGETAPEPFASCHGGVDPERLGRGDSGEGRAA